MAAHARRGEPQVGREVRRRADDLLERFSLTEAGNKVVKDYSGGMRRRLDLAGAIIARPFVEAGIAPRYAMRGRFAQTLVSLVRHGLGVSLIDEFSVAEVYMPGLVRRPLAEDVRIRSFVVRKKGRVLSAFAEHAIGQFRKELRAAANLFPAASASQG